MSSHRVDARPLFAPVLIRPRVAVDQRRLARCEQTRVQLLHALQHEADPPATMDSKRLGLLRDKLQAERASHTAHV